MLAVNWTKRIYCRLIDKELLANFQNENRLKHKTQLVNEQALAVLAEPTNLFSLKNSVQDLKLDVQN